MFKLTTGLAALVVGAMPIALAQSSLEAMPYSIALNGSLHPSNPQAITYPFRAANQGLDGRCDLALHLDKKDQIAMISLLSCSDPLFVEAAEEFIERQETPGDRQSVVLSKRLRINWKMDPVQRKSSVS